MVSFSYKGKVEGTMVKRFLLGASTSAFQVEGGFEGGKGLQTTDVASRT